MKQVIIAAARTINPLKSVLAKNKWQRMECGSDWLYYRENQKGICHISPYYDDSDTGHVYGFEPKYISRRLEKDDLLALKLVSSPNPRLHRPPWQGSSISIPHIECITYQIECITYQITEIEYNLLLENMKMQEKALKGNDFDFNQLEKLLDEISTPVKNKDFRMVKRKVNSMHKLIKEGSHSYNLLPQLRRSIRSYISNFKVIDLYNF